MIFVDTNYFLRFLLADNPVQHEKAKQLFLDAAQGRIQLFTSVAVIFEIYWVLSSFYKKERAEIVGVLKNVFDLDFIKIEDKEILSEASNIYKKTSFDLEDSYNLAFAKGHKADKFKTFDEKLEKAFLRVK